MEENYKIQTICEMKSKLVDALNAELCKGIQQIDAKEAGEVADIIKDLSEAEKNCYEACYYKTVVKAMKEDPAEEDEEYSEMYGYSRNQPKTSSGRFAKDRGTGNGYGMGYGRPKMDQMNYMREYIDDPEGFRDNMRMGYPMNGNMGMTTNQTGNDIRYGQAYNEYARSRKHYTETHQDQYKNEMAIHANEHVNDTVTTIRDIWKTADTDLKKRMKADLTALLGEMTV